MKSTLIMLFLFLPIKALEIRKPLSDEIEETAKVYHLSWLNTYNFDAPPITLEECLRRWTLYYKNSKIYNKSVILIAHKDNKIVGVSYAGPKTRSKSFEYHDCELDKLYILPEYKRQGIGKALMKATLRELHNLGYKKAIVQSLSLNKNADNFYQKMGGTLIGHDKDMNVYEFNLAI